MDELPRLSKKGFYFFHRLRESIGATNTVKFPYANGSHNRKKTPEAS